MSERPILIGAIFLVVVVVTAGVLLLRALKRRRSKRHGHFRRRAHRSRNPTLAETGGLPPVRSNEPLNPPQTRPQPQ